MDEVGLPDGAEKPRTLARRKQVLEAAERCFRRHGFHACSMSEISAEAGMSVGHIYRYFTGKDAIIADIVRGATDEILSEMALFPMDAADPRAALLEQIEQSAMKELEPGRSTLMIEIRAEAARNPAIADMVRTADIKISEPLENIIRIATGHALDPVDLAARVEMFHIIFQGLALRAVINPSADRPALARRVKLSIAAVLAS